MHSDVKEKISQAKTALVVDNPFIATLICGLKVLEDTKAGKTMATDGKYLFVNPEGIKALTGPEVRWALANITMRLVFTHYLKSRIGHRNEGKWDVAADIVVNHLLEQEKREGRSTVGTPWADAIRHPQLAEKGQTTEGVYALIPDPSPEEIENALHSIIRDEMDPGEEAEEEARMHVKIAQARDVAKMAGMLSESMARFVGEELTPKVRWQDQLRNFFTRRAHTERSWARLNRRFSAQGIYMPSMDGNGMDDILIAVDLSGSVTEAELQEFLTELRAIKADCRPWVTHVIYFAHSVTRYEAFGQDEDLDLRPNGTGGTAFSPIFRYAHDHDIAPACAVILTDLYCSDFGPSPGYPVLWTSTGATGPTPFGEVIMLREDRQ